MDALLSRRKAGGYQTWRLIAPLVLPMLRSTSRIGPQSRSARPGFGSKRLLPLLAGMGLAAFGVQAREVSFGPVPFVQVPLLAVSPTVDGKLDDAVWQEAAALGSFVRMSGIGRPTQPTEAWVFATETHLYLGVRCAEPEGERIKCAVTQRDGPVWTDDCVEVFVQPPAEVPSGGAIEGKLETLPYYHFIVNSRGVLYDERNRDARWDGEWKAATAWEEGGWTVEFALPFSLWGGLPPAEARWRLNVCRSRTPQPELSCWSPTGSGFHVPKRFGEVSFGGKAWVSAWDWGNPWPGAHTLRVTVRRHTEEPTPSQITSLVQQGRQTSARAVSTLTLRGKEQTLAHLYFLAVEGPAQLVATVTMGDPGELLTRQVYYLNVAEVSPQVRTLRQRLQRLRTAMAATDLPSTARARLEQLLSAQERAVNERVQALREVRDPAQWQALAAELQRLEQPLSILEVRLAAYRRVATLNSLPTFGYGVDIPLRKYLRQDPFLGTPEGVVRFSAARNEYEAAQLLLFAFDQPLQEVRLEFSDLVQGGRRLSREHLSWRLVGYVPTEKPIYEVRHVGLWPDPLKPVDSFEVEANSFESVWLTVYVPPDTPAGRYRGTLTVRPANVPPRTVPVELRVWDFALPRENHLRTAFGLGVPAKYHPDYDRYRDNYFAHRVNPTGLGGPKIEPPFFDWPGATQLAGWMYGSADSDSGASAPSRCYNGAEAPDSKGPLYFVWETAQGRRYCAGPLPIVPLTSEAGSKGRWHPFAVNLRGTEEPVVRFRFEYRDAGPLTLYLDDLWLLGEQSRRVDDFEGESGWYACGPWAQVALSTERAHRGKRCLRFTVEPTEREEWLDEWPAAARTAWVRPDVPLRLDWTEFDARVEKYLPRGLNSFVLAGLPSVGRETSPAEAVQILAQRGTAQLARAMAAHLRERGWLHLAYTYLFDEPEPKHYPTLNLVLGTVHRAAPGLKNLMTARHFPPELKHVDIWCPEVFSFDPRAARAEQAQGKEVWWYVAFSTRHPYPNYWIDYPALDCRVHFWMTWKHRLNGVLYWSATYWARVNPWESGHTYPGANGDGSLLYPGEDGGPVDSIRWECIRDGLEDYEVFYLLQTTAETLRRLPGSFRQRKLLAEADRLLAIDDRVVRSYREYNPDPTALLAAREQMNALLERMIRALGGPPKPHRSPLHLRPLEVQRRRSDRRTGAQRRGRLWAVGQSPPLSPSLPTCGEGESGVHPASCNAPSASSETGEREAAPEDLEMLLTALGVAVAPLTAQAPEQPQLVLYYHFEDRRPFAVDHSGRQNHGLVRGARRTAGPKGTALAFDGERGRILLPEGRVLLGPRPRQGTIAFWLRPDFAPESLPRGQWEGYQVFFYLMETDGNLLPDGFDEIGLFVHGDRLIAKVAGPQTGPFVNLPSPLKQGEWAHLALTWEPRRRVLYLNGEPVVTNTEEYPPSALDDFRGMVGEHPSSGRWHFKGAMDEIRVYNYALPPAEIRALAVGP
ncbi:MAG TPA: DUF4091 domain-containing protein [Armatimonadetes bacterium]|nr:DUF4091 domain-containing protein [Armatimonadota bacterium]